MQQNCKQACSDPNAASAESSSATEATPANCLSWAKRGLCDSDSDYSHFMELNCKETCDNLDEARSPPLSRLPTNPFATTAPALRPTRTRAIRCEWHSCHSLRMADPKERVAAFFCRSHRADRRLLRPDGLGGEESARPRRQPQLRSEQELAEGWSSCWSRRGRRARQVEQAK